RISHIQQLRRFDADVSASREQHVRARLSVFGAIGGPGEREQIADAGRLDQWQREGALLVSDTARENTQAFERSQRIDHARIDATALEQTLAVQVPEERGSGLEQRRIRRGPVATKRGNPAEALLHAAARL